MAEATFTLLGRRFVARGAFISLERAYHLADGGGWSARDVVRHPGSAAVVVWDGERVHLVSQYRAALGATLLELPAGKLDIPGEPPEETARRECQEELGLRPAKVTLLHTAHTSPGFTDELTRVYLAEELERVPACPQGVEEAALTAVVLTPAEIAAALEAGALQDAKTILGLQALLRRLHR